MESEEEAQEVDRGTGKSLPLEVEPLQLRTGPSHSLPLNNLTQQ